MRKHVLTLSGAAAVILVCAASTPVRANQEMLASAKSLYESASYEAALSQLSAINTAELVDTVDTYKALCLLGLGRVRDAEQALELLVTRQPLLALSDTEYSPRVVSLFRDVRKKALPAAAQQLYTVARSDYENKNYEAAAIGFKQALQVMSDIGPEARTATLDDLRELASGFLTLADAKLAAAPAPVPVRAPAAAAAAPAPAPVATRIMPTFFTLADVDVTPPAVIDQQVPPWTFTAYAPNRVFNGTLELIIDEKGLVESVALTEPVWPPYDLALIQAAKRWSYRPAVKAGTPVKFKRVLVINIDPSTLRAR
jgi:tetratricopeptide (TPR) repeat protein